MDSQEESEKKIEEEVSMSPKCLELFQTWKGLCKTDVRYYKAAKEQISQLDKKTIKEVETFTETFLEEDESVQVELIQRIIKFVNICREKNNYSFDINKVEYGIFLNNCLLRSKKGSKLEMAIMRMSPDDNFRLYSHISIVKFLETSYEKLFEDFIKERGEENINNHVLNTPLDERTIILIINFWWSHSYSKIDDKFYEPLINITSDILEYMGRLKPFKEEEEEEEEEEEKKDEKDKKEEEGIEEKWKKQKSILFRDLFHMVHSYSHRLTREEKEEVERKGEEFKKPKNKLTNDGRIINTVKRVLKEHIKRIYEIAISNNLNKIKKYVNIYPSFNLNNAFDNPPSSLPIPSFSSYIDYYPFSYNTLVGIMEKDEDEGLWREEEEEEGGGGGEKEEREEKGEKENEKEKERMLNGHAALCIGLSSVNMLMVRVIDKMKVEEIKEKDNDDDDNNNKLKKNDKRENIKDKKINTFSTLKEKGKLLSDANKSAWRGNSHTSSALFHEPFRKWPELFKNYVKNFISYSFLHSYYSIPLSSYSYDYYQTHDDYDNNNSSDSSLSSDSSAPVSPLVPVQFLLPHKRCTPQRLLFQSHLTSMFLSYSFRREDAVGMLRSSTNINTTEGTYLVDWLVKREEEGGCDIVKLLMEVGCRERVRVRRDFDISGGKGWADKVKEGEKVEWDEGGELERSDDSMFAVVDGLASLYTCVHGYIKYVDDPDKMNTLWLKRGEEGKRALENIEDVLEEEDARQCVMMYLTYNDVETAEDFIDLYINDPQKIVQQYAMEGMPEMLCPLGRYSPLREMEERKEED